MVRCHDIGPRQRRWPRWGGSEGYPRPLPDHVSLTHKFMVGYLSSIDTILLSSWYICCWSCPQHLHVWLSRNICYCKSRSFRTEAGPQSAEAGGRTCHAVLFAQ